MTDVQGTLIVLHGPPKVGKTQLCDSFPGPVVFLATEAGHKFIRKDNKKRVISLPPEQAGWATLLKAISSGDIQKRKPKTIVVDTTQKLYDRCMDYVCAKNSVSHPSDGAHGKIWNAVSTEFMRGVEKLCAVADELGATLIFIDHTDTKEIKLQTSEFTRLDIALSTQPARVVLPAADHIWFLGYEESADEVSADASGEALGNNRWLWLQGNSSVNAGTRDPGIDAKVIKNLPKHNPYSYVAQKLNGSQLQED